MGSPHHPPKPEKAELKSNISAPNEALLQLARLLARQAAREMLSRPSNPTQDKDDGTQD